MLKSVIRPFFWASLAFLVLSGCGESGTSPGDSVSGKVTLGGQPVAGTVVFVWPDRKEMSAPLTVEGKYQILNPAKGEVQILVKAPATMVVPKGAKALEMPGAVPTVGTLPPEKYAKPKNGLAFNITGGQQTYDIVLEQ